MNVSPIHDAHSARGLDLVQFFRTYEDLQDQRDARAPGLPATGVPPLAWTPSAARDHPSRRPAFLKGPLPVRGRNAGGGQPRVQLARPDAELPELPTWNRMAPGDRDSGPIPGNNRMEAPLQAHTVHGRRVGADDVGRDGRAQQARSQPTAAGLGGRGMSGREAILGRGRWEAWSARHWNAMAVPVAA